MPARYLRLSSSVGLTQGADVAAEGLYPLGYSQACAAAPRVSAHLIR